MTIRTFYTIHNLTMFTYILRVYDDQLEEFEIHPNEKLPILCYMKNKKCSICIANEKDDEDWSESFDLLEILHELNVGKEKAYIVHGLSYTFLSKQVDKDVDICYNLNLLAPVIMRNCLPFNIDVKLPTSNQEYYILKGEEAYFLAYDLIETFVIKMKMDGFDYTTIKIDPKTVGNEIKFNITDFEGVELTLFVKVERERAGFELILYSKVLIINYTGLSIGLQTVSKGFKKQVAGQKLIGKPCMMTNKASKLIVSYKGARSYKLKTKQIGFKDDFKIRVRNDETGFSSLYEFVFSTSLNLVTNKNTNSELFCKNVKIFPKYVIVNHLSTPVKYCQLNNPDDHKILQPNEREILYWPSDQFPPMISLKSYDFQENSEAEDNSTKWDWTRGIPVKLVGIISVQARSNRDSLRYKLLRVEKRLIESTIYITIDKEDMEHPTYMIEN